MSKEQLKAFLKKVESDTSLQEKMKAAGDADAVIALAKEVGFMISAEDIADASSELSEEDLESVAGGVFSGDFSGGAYFAAGTGVAVGAALLFTIGYMYKEKF